jgi:tripartite-type tricarboxylate transporter receptor subunit TctC
LLPCLHNAEETAVKLARRTFLRLALGPAALLTISRKTWAQAYPTRPVRLIVGFAPGGTPDLLARIVGEWLSERLGQPFVIENRPGSGSNTATEAVVNAPPDGYTLLLASIANSVNATLYEKLGYNFIRDVAPVAGLDRQPQVVVVNPSIAPKTLPEFIAYAKAHPGKINMASPGNGTGPHIAGELFKMMAGVDMVHVPYRAGSLLLTDLLSGQVQVFFGATASTIEYIRSGRLQPLAVTTSARLEALPDIPAVREFVAGYEATQWYGIVAPKNTPPEIVNKLNGQINAAFDDVRTSARFAALGGAHLRVSPAELGKLIAEETEKWATVVKFAGLRP